MNISQTKLEPICQEQNKTLTVYAESSSKIKNILGLSYLPVGVKFVNPNEELPSDVDILSKKSRYCQLLMRARKGEMLTLLPKNLVCPATYAVFGFGQLLEKRVYKSYSTPG
ncbi:MAG: DUF169 domain-containing protein [Nitrososphaerales archaeon]